MEAESIRGHPIGLDPCLGVRFRVSRSSGPGGQHANTSETRVEARFDVYASESLTERQKQRVRPKAGAVVRAVAQDERSQARNRDSRSSGLSRRSRRRSRRSGDASRRGRPPRRASAGSRRSAVARVKRLRAAPSGE